MSETNVPSFRRIASIIVPTLFVAVSACRSGSSNAVPTVVSAPAAVPPARIARNIPRNVLYVSDYTNLDVMAFSADPHAQNTQPLLTIGLGAHPYGLWVDRQGVLYVAAGDSVQEFKPGATTPFLKIIQGINRAEGVVVDSKGTLYVVINAGVDVAVVEYPAGSTTPSQTLTMTVSGSQFGFPGGATFDSAGNLYVDATFYPESTGHIFRFAPGQTTGTDLGLADAGSQDGLAVDAKGNLYVGFFGQVEVYRPGATQPFKTIGVPSDYPSFFARSPKGIVYEPVAASVPSNSAVLEFAPTSQKPVNSITGSFFSAPVGAAVRSAAF